jgi:hypothetical protein
MAEFVVYLRVQPTPEDKQAMDDEFDSMLPRVTYVTDGVRPKDMNPCFTVEYNSLVGETSGRRFVTLHYEPEDVVIKASFTGLGMAALAAGIGNRSLDDLVDKAEHSPDQIMYVYVSPFSPYPPKRHQ